MLIGLACYLVLPGDTALRALGAGDAFFFTYLVQMAVLSLTLESADLKAQAWSDDEGMPVIFLIVFIALGISMAAVFSLINAKAALSPIPLILAGVAEPLGWFTLHTVAAFHYANLYYGRPKDAPPPLLFLGDTPPGASDFLYFSFVIGMTAQVSDVQVTSPRLRRATLGHSIVSFFYNTTIFAMAVNAAVNL